MSTKLAKIVADFTAQLTTQLSIGGTTATLSTATDDDAVALPAGTYFFTLDGANSSKEHIVATLSGTSLTAISSVSRQGAQASGAVRLHRVGTTVTITDFAHILYMNNLLAGTTGFDATGPIKYDANFTPTLGQYHIPTWDYVKSYTDAIVIAGGVDALTTTKGISKLSSNSSTNMGTLGVLNSLGTATMTIATPAVGSLTAHGLVLNDIIQFTTTGTLPTGVTANTNYYVISAGLTANAFEFSASLGGAAVNTSGSQSGTHTLFKLATISIATPAVMYLTAHGFTAGDTFQLTTTGALPTGVTVSTTYYVISTGLTSNSFQFSATFNGSAVNTSGTQSGTHTLLRTTPYAVGNDDTRLPTQAENDAMAGSLGTPSSSNPFVTQQEVRTVTAMGAQAIDGTLGSIFTRTLTANETFTQSGFTTGRVFMVEVKQGGGTSYTATWFAGITWVTNGATAPVQTVTTNGITTYAFRCTGANTFLGYLVATQ